MPKPKMQAQLDGYLAWAWERLLEELGEGNQSETTRMVFREWLELEATNVETRYGISRDRWKEETGQKVSNISRGRGSGA